MSIFNYKHWMQLSPKDWVLRIISLGLAIVLWYFVGGEDIVNKNVLVRVEVINLPRDLVISNQFKKEIEVSVSGPRSLVLDIENLAISRQIDLAKATPGTMVIDNNNDDIPVPRGVNVLRIQPKSVILSLDKLIQKQLEVNPVTIGNVAPDYVLKEIRMEPDSISITGPETVLSQFEVLRTKEIDIGGLSASTQKQIPLELDPVIVDLIGATTVTADLVIQVKTVKKKIPNFPVEVIIDGVKQRVTPAKVSITVALPKTLIRKKVDLNSLFKVTATDEENDGQMQVKVTPTKKFSNPIQILKIDPQVVTLIAEPGQQNTDKK
ncbi:MAG TPA: YbbR-like domain-containing protein [Desulfobacterales bacterium]|nr:YbbR-like domain-containing protein [Desulfobacterales bacterium]HIP38157.1 YbbR-like domain-containing protein [Desulfocapsa sulfexigens]